MTARGRPAGGGRELRRGAAMATLLAASLAATAAAQVRFEDRSAELGVAPEFAYGSPDRPYVTDSGGSGAAWLDYDVDGRLDLLTLAGMPGPSDRPAEATAAAQAGEPLPESRLENGSVPRHALHRNTGETFTRVDAAGLAESAWTGGAAVADVDDDGYPDVYVTAIGPNRLYRNNGDGTFTPAPTGIEHPGWGTGAAWADLDLDGDLDLYLANYVDFDATAGPADVEGACAYLGLEVFCGPRGLPGERDVLYRNEGDGTWVPWPGIEPDPEATYGFAVLPTDCDGDGTPEIYVANDSNINLLYRVRDGMALSDLSLFSGAGYSASGLEQAGMGIAAGDVDDDGDFDLLVSNFQHDYETLYRNLGSCTFVDVTPEVGLAGPTYPYMGWGAVLADFDGDTDLDLFVANGHIYPQVEDAGLEPFGQPDQLFLNQLRETGDSDFAAAPDGGGEAVRRPLSSRGVAFGDPDDDGDLDLVVTHVDAPPVVLINESTPGDRLRVTLIGDGANRSAYGAVVEVHSGNSRQRIEHRHGDGYLGSNDPRRLFALPSGAAERVVVRWPGGQETVLQDIAPGWIVVRQGRGVVARRS